jgi:hypothetical protein
VEVIYLCYIHLIESFAQAFNNIFHTEMVAVLNKINKAQNEGSDEVPLIDGQF